MQKHSKRFQIQLHNKGLNLENRKRKLEVKFNRIESKGRTKKKHRMGTKLNSLIAKLKK